MPNVLKARNIDLQLRIRLVKFYVRAMLQYVCETWTLNSDMIKQLEAVGMWFLRRMIRISWTDTATHEEVLHDWKIFSISNKSTKTIQVQLYTIAKKKKT